jgi:hypothetical protein
MITVEFAVESGETRECQVPAVPREGEELVWMSSDVYPGSPDPVQTETTFLVEAVEWFIWERDELTTPGATVRVQLVRTKPYPAVGATPPWMQLDSFDLGETWREARIAVKLARDALAEAEAAEQEAARRSREYHAS